MDNFPYNESHTVTLAECLMVLLAVQSIQVNLTPLARIYRLWDGPELTSWGPRHCLYIYKHTLALSQVERSTQIFKKEATWFSKTGLDFLGGFMQLADIVEATIVGWLFSAAGNLIANVGWNTLNKLGLSLFRSNQLSRAKWPVLRNIHQKPRGYKALDVWGEITLYRSHILVWRHWQLFYIIFLFF